jgi:hypothetical protein
MRKIIRLTESEKTRILGMHKSATSKHYLMEQVLPKDYVDAFNTIITPWMTNMEQKLKSSGFSCKSLGYDDCDENLYGFKLLNAYGVEKYKYNYYFPYESGVNLKLTRNENDPEDMYFVVFMGGGNILGTYGKGAKNTQEINNAANESIKKFEESASRAFSRAYPS